MDFFAVYWPAFLAALTANLITVVVIYAAVLRHQGHSTGLALTKAGQTLMAVSWKAVQLYVGLIFLGAIAYAIKVLVTG